MPELTPALSARIAADIRRRRLRIVLVDGPSGAGKSTFAQELVARLPSARLVQMDEIYPGWDGLAAASLQTERLLVGPLRHGMAGRYRRWNWAAGASAAWCAVSATATLVLEGCGSATRRNRGLADLSIWVEADDEIRRARAIDRDGPVFAAHWAQWDAQFRAHVARNDPRASADHVLVTG